MRLIPDLYPRERMCARRHTQTHADTYVHIQEDVKVVPPAFTTVSLYNINISASVQAKS